jgi:hypothetical protein
VTVVITEEPLVPKAVNGNFCAGDSVNVYGVWYSVAGGYTDTVLSATGGCDTLLNITIVEDPLITNTVNDSYCAGDSVLVYGVWYSSVGSFTDTVASTTGGCDTIVTIDITEDPLETNTVNASHCPGDSVQVYGVWYAGIGSFTDTVSSVTSSCDTVVTVVITEEPLVPKAVNGNFCAGDSVQVYGVWYNSAGNFTDTVLSTTGGCDTLLNITIVEDPLLTKTVNDSYCAGDSVMVYGIWYSSTGTFTDTTASTTGGCDTILMISITEDPLITNTVNDRCCCVCKRTR